MIVAKSRTPIELAADVVNRCKYDPEYLREAILYVKLDSVQREVFDNVWLNSEGVIGGEGLARDAWVAANGVGKTYTVAAICLGFCFAFRPSKVIITSKTGRQTERQTWDEVQAIYANSKFFQDATDAGYPFGDMQQTTFRVYSENRKSYFPGWYIVHFSIAGGKTATGNEVDAQIEAAFEGWHQQNILLALDEAKAQHPAIFRGAERLFTNIDGVCRMIAVGSSGYKKAAFGNCFYGREAQLYRHHKTTMLESPRGNKNRAQQIIDTWGREHPLTKSMVFAEFYDQDEDSLIPLDDIEKCIRRDDTIKPEGKEGQIAIDWARQGDCETVFGIRTGNYVHPFKAWKKQSGVWSAGEVARLAREYPDYPIISDETGLGGPIQDLVAAIQSENGKKISIQGLLVGNPAQDSEHFANIKAEMYVQLARRFELGDISIPDDPILINQLATIRKEFDTRGRLRIVSKAEMAEEGVVSPDRADDLAMLFYSPKKKPSKVYSLPRIF